MRRALFGLTLASLLLRGDGCEPQVIDNPSFDAWEGENLLAWEIEAGEVRKVSTWHKGDYGVELVGEEVALSQLVTEHFECLHFDLLADVDGPQVFVELDFFDDGSIEHQERVAGVDFAPVRFRVAMPPWYESVRFRIHKQGDGRAVLAQVLLVAGEGCDTEPILLHDIPLGSLCSDGDACSSGLCLDPAEDDDLDGICAECDADTACSPGLVCGRGYGTWATLACGTAGRHLLGETCFGDAECLTGLCCGGVCSTCCDGDPCAAGTCAASSDLPFAAHVCRSPGGALGAPCLSDDDCASDTCEGGVDFSQCAYDGRHCATPEDCLLGAFGETCDPAGRLGGSCGG